MLVSRFIVDAPALGVWNMAVDEALLESAANDQLCTLRFYGWSEPTLSLGYFQTSADRAQHAASLNCPVVRRLSGGGAILHDDELTYSFAAPATLSESAHAQLLYDAFHHTLIEVLSTSGIRATSWEDNSACLPEDEPFLCFQRRARGDVVAPSPLAGSIKIAGSAQRRRRGAILQHGSILWGRSKAAPELPGLAQVVDLTDLSRRHLLDAWSGALAARLQITFGPGDLSPREMERARQLQREKYGSAIWNERK